MIILMDSIWKHVEETHSAFEHMSKVTAWKLVSLRSTYIIKLFQLNICYLTWSKMLGWWQSLCSHVVMVWLQCSRHFGLPLLEYCSSQAVLQTMVFTTVKQASYVGSLNSICLNDVHLMNGRAAPSHHLYHD